MSKHRDRQALNAVEKAMNAVGQTGDHASEQLVEQAENSLIHAEVAVGQAQQDGDNSEAIQQASAQLEQAQRKLPNNGSR